ncbi:cupin domain-containing protein [Streptomonospora litoralis]|uniref:3-hydroxyanthranilate 3,4-dioxygenase n=1 Tax=Streptomonospora litoralis TaxID=2498135 RepID=A0A4P6Q165_9ACTN|nr:cupin domain-containing protein [Streptomonospora litoralis]QBI54366.1 3-hydroxyanthranilate 3,4-dioxygenase [Streptomonospora litoralis]
MSEHTAATKPAHAAPAPGPVATADAFAAIDRLWSPHVLARVNDHEVRLAKVEGDHIWHVHDDTDEFFLVLDGRLDIGLREHGRERTVSLKRGSAFCVPRGVEHRPSSPEGASLLLVESAGTLSTGDRTGEEVPAHVDSTRGHELG